MVVNKSWVTLPLTPPSPSTDPKTVGTGLESIANMRWTKQGRLRRRPGTTWWPIGGTIARPQLIASHGDSVFVLGHQGEVVSLPPTYALDGVTAAFPKKNNGTEPILRASSYLPSGSPGDDVASVSTAANSVARVVCVTNEVGGVPTTVAYFYSAKTNEFLFQAFAPHYGIAVATAGFIIIVGRNAIGIPTQTLQARVWDTSSSAYTTSSGALKTLSTNLQTANPLFAAYVVTDPVSTLGK